MNKELDFARKLYKCNNINETIPYELIKQVLNEKYLDCYNACIINEISITQYAKTTNITPGSVETYMAYIHDAICRQKEIAEKYHEIHGEYPYYLSSRSWRGQVCEIDFIDISSQLRNIIYFNGIRTIKQLIKILSTNPESVKKWRNMGNVSYNELITWFNNKEINN